MQTSMAAAVEYTGYNYNKLVITSLKEKIKINGDVGVISINAEGDVGISFNSKRMHRAWMSSDTNYRYQFINYKQGTC